MSASLSKYRSAFHLSQVLFDQLQLADFPVNPFSIIPHKKSEPVFVKTLEEYNFQHVYSLSIKDAKCFYIPGKAYLIIYNSNMPENRIRFSLIHEIAHIVLHHLDDERTEICRGESVHSRLYCIMEGEANTFAGNFIAPPILINEKLSGKDFDVQIVSSFFGLSQPAVKDYRHEDYREWIKTTPTAYEQHILERCRDYLFPKYCLSCKSFIYGKNNKFCPVCGNELSDIDFYKGAIEPMIYSSIETNKNGRPTRCPRCDNEQPVSDGDYCIICGAPIYNRCAPTMVENEETGDSERNPPCDNSRILPGNARFYPYCGNETTYYQAKLLKDWEDEKAEHENKFVENSSLPF